MKEIDLISRSLAYGPTCYITRQANINARASVWWKPP